MFQQPLTLTFLLTHNHSLALTAASAMCFTDCLKLHPLSATPNKDKTDLHLKPLDLTSTGQSLAFHPLRSTSEIKRVFEHFPLMSFSTAF